MVFLAKTDISIKPVFPGNNSGFIMPSPGSWPQMQTCLLQLGRWKLCREQGWLVGPMCYASPRQVPVSLLKCLMGLDWMWESLPKRGDRNHGSRLRLSSGVMSQVILCLGPAVSGTTLEVRAIVLARTQAVGSKLTWCCLVKKSRMVYWVLQ